jgi:hypothetical protein
MVEEEIISGKSLPRNAVTSESFWSPKSAASLGTEAGQEENPNGLGISME